MKLNRSLDLEYFFDKVRQCQGRVTFETTEGDVLNLKSALCLFVFTAASRDDHMYLQGELHCEDPDDEALLAEFTGRDE